MVEQVENLDKTGQFRFTPPTHTILAFNQALEEFWAEGGLQGRAARYQQNRSILKDNLAKMGFKELVADKDAGYIITSYLCPGGNFDFKMFYNSLSKLGEFKIMIQQFNPNTLSLLPNLTRSDSILIISILFRLLDLLCC